MVMMMMMIMMIMMMMMMMMMMMTIVTLTIVTVMMLLRMQEDHHGRARVHRQWGDSEDEIREAMDLCPVDCIHYVSRSQLALLE